MKAIYQENPYCESCIDIYGVDVVSECKHCMEINRHEVEVLQFGVGISGDRAVIRKSDGSICTVPFSSLTLRGQ